MPSSLEEKAMAKMADNMYALFMAFVQAGFNDEQATSIVVAIVRNGGPTN